jgi:hypothetical protein
MLGCMKALGNLAVVANCDTLIDNQHPAQDVYAALGSLSKDKLLLLQKDLHDRMIRSDDCLSNCNRDIIPQLMAHANYIEIAPHSGQCCTN